MKRKTVVHVCEYFMLESMNLVASFEHGNAGRCSDTHEE